MWNAINVLIMIDHLWNYFKDPHLYLSGILVAAAPPHPLDFTWADVPKLAGAVYILFKTYYEFIHPRLFPKKDAGKPVE